MCVIPSEARIELDALDMELKMAVSCLLWEPNLYPLEEYQGLLNN